TQLNSAPVSTRTDRSVRFWPGLAGFSISMSTNVPKDMPSSTLSVRVVSMRGNALVAMSQVGTLRKRPDCTLQQMQLSADLTVIVPAYNEAACVADTIRSLRAQTAPPRKIIVVDDCSTDGTG